MSLFLHLSSALVFFALLYVLRRVLTERDFLRTLIAAQRSGHKLCICPLVFVRRFAILFKVDLQVQDKVQLSLELVNVQVFLDFYRQHGIKSMSVFRHADGGCRLKIDTETPQDAGELCFPTGVFGKGLEVEVSS